MKSQPAGGPGSIAAAVRQSQSPISRKAYGQASLGVAAREVGSCSAKQSQLTADASCQTKPIRGEGVSSLKWEVSSNTPARGGDPSRGRLGHIVAGPACETKPIRVDCEREPGAHWIKQR